MIKKSLYLLLFGSIALGVTGLSALGSAEAALFDQEEVEADRFVAIAVPLPQGDRYNLLVLEQKSDARPCWEEDTETGKIEPLLLTFDFSGICGRSTDSNGYSIRQVGEDLALKYRLSMQKKDDVLILMGIPLNASEGKPFEIGRTKGRIQSEGEDFLKITLNPDWKLTRRVYQGQPLGHIYFTRDVIPPEPELVVESSETIPDSATSDAETSDAETSDAETSDLEVEVEETQADQPESTQSSGLQPFDQPIQIPVPTPPLSQSVQPSGISAGSLNTVRPVADVDVSLSPFSPLPVPTLPPLGQVGASEPDVFSPRDLAQVADSASIDAGAPPPPAFSVALSIRRYRVFVDESDATTQSNVVNALAPDAFWTNHQGRRMLQMGSFVESEKADTMVQSLARQGINATIDASQY